MGDMKELDIALLQKIHITRSMHGLSSFKEIHNHLQTTPHDAIVDALESKRDALASIPAL